MHRSWSWSHSLINRDSHGHKWVRLWNLPKGFPKGSESSTQSTWQQPSLESMVSWKTHLVIYLRWCLQPSGQQWCCSWPWFLFDKECPCLEPQKGHPLKHFGWVLVVLGGEACARGSDEGEEGNWMWVRRDRLWKVGLWWRGGVHRWRWWSELWRGGRWSSWRRMKRGAWFCYGVSEGVREWGLLWQRFSGWGHREWRRRLLLLQRRNLSCYRRRRRWLLEPHCYPYLSGNHRWIEKIRCLFFFSVYDLGFMVLKPIDCGT